MRVLPPLVITDALLTSSSVVETAPAAYSAVVTYALGATASNLAANTILVYRSLQAGNLNHTPASSPTWWVLIGTTYPVYSTGTTYALNEYALDVVNHLEYKSLIAGNLNQPLIDTTKWQLQGPTNRWRAFDLLRNTGSTAPSPQVYVITPGVRIDSIGLVGLVASQVTISVVVGASEIYNEVIDLTSRTTVTASDYCFGMFTFKSGIARFNLPRNLNAVITVTVTRSTGEVTVGGLLIGTSVYIGRTLHDAESDALNFSTIARTFAGSSLLTQRRTIPKTNQTVRCKKANINKVIAARTALNAVPALWSGLDDTDSGYFEALLILGIYKQFKINMDQPDDALVTIELEEV